ncbi:hypothetical protein C8Q73DRAFT_694930 [Cubamyces lactineus]|nr:hypothetical protein C8Q73DRAFT_694930 [Cubamyces lactineus]
MWASRPGGSCCSSSLPDHSHNLAVAALEIMRNMSIAHSLRPEGNRTYSSIIDKQPELSVQGFPLILDFLLGSRGCNLPIHLSSIFVNLQVVQEPMACGARRRPSVIRRRPDSRLQGSLANHFA